MEKMVRRHSRPVECRGEQDIEIEQGKWRDQEIRFVDVTEFHRFYALFSQDRDSGQYHPKQQNDRQDSEIFWHQSSRIARVRSVSQLIPGTPFKSIGKSDTYPKPCFRPRGGNGRRIVRGCDVRVRARHWRRLSAADAD